MAAVSLTLAWCKSTRVKAFVADKALQSPRAYVTNFTISLKRSQRIFFYRKTLAIRKCKYAEQGQVKRTWLSPKCYKDKNGMPGNLPKLPYFPCIKAAASSEFTGEKQQPNLEDSKKALIRAVANTNRGKNTTPEQRKHILKMIIAIEDANPTANPVTSPFLSGYWSLLYTAPTDETGSDRFAGTQEGPFLARVKPLAFGSIRQTKSSQVIDIDRGIAKNIADFTIFGKHGTLTIEGKATPSHVNDLQTTRLDVMFESFLVRIGDWTSPKISLKWINPQGWVDTTYLDEDMRVGRGDKGSVFLSIRAKTCHP